MDALDLVKNDHDRIRYALNDLKGAKNEREKRRLIAQLDQQVQALFFVEETILYTHFKDYEAFREVLGTTNHQHDTAKNHLQKLRSGEQFSEADLKQFVTEMETHMKEEEASLFPMVRHEMRRPEREKLGRVMQAAKEERSIAA